MQALYITSVLCKYIIQKEFLPPPSPFINCLAVTNIEKAKGSFVMTVCLTKIVVKCFSYVSTNPSLTSETYHFKKGTGQSFYQPTHFCHPGTFNEDQLVYNTEREVIPVAIHCVAEEPADGEYLSITCYCELDYQDLITYIFIYSRTSAISYYHSRD